MAQEKWIMTQTMHLGGCDMAFGAGTVIAHDTEMDCLKIRGCVYQNTIDLRILKKHGWVVPYSEEAIAEYEAEEEDRPFVQPVPEELQEKRHMEVVQSDADLMNKDIDISWTKNRPQELEAGKDKELPVIRGDESLEERQRRVNELKSTPAKMPVVQDDSLGMDGMSSLNSGQVPVRTAEEHARLRAEAERKIQEKAGNTETVTKPNGTRRKKKTSSKKKATGTRKARSTTKKAKKAKKPAASQEDVVRVPVEAPTAASEG
jgi:hypothetical protein